MVRSKLLGDRAATVAGSVPEHYKLCFCGVTGSEMAKRSLIVEDGGDLRAIVAAVLTRVGGYATIPPLKDFFNLDRGRQNVGSSLLLRRLLYHLPVIASVRPGV
jgi:hypothetical protein